MTIRKIRHGVALGGAVVASLVFSSSALAANHRAAATFVDPAPPTTTTPTQCTDPTLTQQFSAFGDTNLYAPVPGGTFDDPSGAGWTFLGNASITSTTRPDGTTGGALNLTGGSSATSPVTCVTVDYPTARMFVNQTAGGDDVHFKVSYWKNGTWSNPKETGKSHGNGKGHGWGLSTPLNVQPTKDDGWQYVQFILAVNGDQKNNFQVDDFYVDPRSSR